MKKSEKRNRRERGGTCVVSSCVQCAACMVRCARRKKLARAFHSQRPLGHFKRWLGGGDSPQKHTSETMEAITFSTFGAGDGCLSLARRLQPLGPFAQALTFIAEWSDLSFLPPHPE